MCYLCSGFHCGSIAGEDRCRPKATRGGIYQSFPRDIYSRERERMLQAATMIPQALMQVQFYRALRSAARNMYGYSELVVWMKSALPMHMCDTQRRWHRHKPLDAERLPIQGLAADVNKHQPN